LSACCTCLKKTKESSCGWQELLFKDFQRGDALRLPKLNEVHFLQKNEERITNNNMGLVTPSLGLVFWTTLAFLIVLFLLKKFAWKPILESLKERENTIADALKAAENAKHEMAQLKASNEELLRKARDERDALMKEARDARDLIVAEAKTKATQEADRILTIARENIKNEKMAAVSELKNQVAVLSIEIAEKILRNELSKDEKQKTLVNNLVEEINLN
jgi:F-type H+-transporting ATPase subunit b